MNFDDNNKSGTETSLTKKILIPILVIFSFLLICIFILLASIPSSDEKIVASAKNENYEIIATNYCEPMGWGSCYFTVNVVKNPDSWFKRNKMLLRYDDLIFQAYDMEIADNNVLYLRFVHDSSLNIVSPYLISNLDFMNNVPDQFSHGKFKNEFTKETIRENKYFIEINASNDDSLDLSIDFGNYDESGNLNYYFGTILALDILKYELNFIDSNSVELGLYWSDDAKEQVLIMFEDESQEIIVLY